MKRVVHCWFRFVAAFARILLREKHGRRPEQHSQLRSQRALLIPLTRISFGHDDEWRAYTVGCKGTRTHRYRRRRR